MLECKNMKLSQTIDPPVSGLIDYNPCLKQALDYRSPNEEDASPQNEKEILLSFEYELMWAGLSARDSFILCLCIQTINVAFQPYHQTTSEHQLLNNAKDALTYFIPSLKHNSDARAKKAKKIPRPKT